MKNTLLVSLTFVCFCSVNSAYSGEIIEKETISALQLALKKDPENPKVLSELGVIYLRSKQYQRAIHPLEKSLIIRKKDSNTHFHLALAYGAVGRHPEKLKELMQAVRLSPEIAEIHLKIALAYAANKRHQKASEYYKKAIKLDPDYPEAHYFLALSYFLTKRYKEALTSIKESIRISPSNAEAHYALGQVYIKLGHFNKAISPLQTAMRIKSELPKNKSKSSDFRKSPQN